MTISIDGVSKRIILNSTKVTASEIWSRWVDWHATNNHWPLAFQLVGGIELGDGLFIPPYFFLINGWRIRPMESNHNLTITGNLFVEGGGVPVVSTLGTFQVNVNYTVPVQAQGISTNGSSNLSASDIVAAIKSELSTELTHLMTLQNGSGLNSAQATMLLEIYRLYGLDPTKPLIVTDTFRGAGSEIQQTIQSNQSQTVITRVA